MSRRHFPHFLVSAISLLASSPVAAETTVLLADGRTITGVSMKPGSGPDQVVLEASGGKVAATVPAQDLLVLDMGKVSGRSPAPSVRMANGDQVYGRVTFPTAKQVRVAAGWGSLTVPLSWCSAIRLDEKAALPAPVAKDTLVFANDRAPGEIQGVANGKVQFVLGGKPLPVDLARVHALALAPRPHPPGDNTGLRLALDLGGGERLSGRWVKLGPDTLTVKLDWGDTVDIPTASLSRLEVKNGKLVYLSDLKPSEVREIPYLEGGSFPYRNDLSVGGTPLKLGGKPYRRGVGVHSRSELTYTLDGSYKTFAATLGLDDSVGTQGSVVFRVFADEKLLFESPPLRGGDLPAEIKLDVKGVILLRLEVDYGENGDAADHADWIEARLLRQ